MTPPRSRSAVSATLYPHPSAKHLIPNPRSGSARSPRATRNQLRSPFASPNLQGTTPSENKRDSASSSPLRATVSDPRLRRPIRRRTPTRISTTVHRAMRMPLPQMRMMVRPQTGATKLLPPQTRNRTVMRAREPPAARIQMPLRTLEAKISTNQIQQQLRDQMPTGRFRGRGSGRCLCCSPVPVCCSSAAS